MSSFPSSKSTGLFDKLMAGGNNTRSQRTEDGRRRTGNAVSGKRKQENVFNWFYYIRILKISSLSRARSAFLMLFCQRAGNDKNTFLIVSWLPLLTRASRIRTAASLSFSVFCEFGLLCDIKSLCIAKLAGWGNVTEIFSTFVFMVLFASISKNRSGCALTPSFGKGYGLSEGLPFSI